VTQIKSPLAGEIVVVTGVVLGMQRWQADTAIMEAGGVAGDTVTTSTTLLVVGERPGQTKLKKAEMLGIPTITEAEFRQRIGR